MGEWLPEHEKARKDIEVWVQDWRDENPDLYIPEYVYDQCHVETDRFIAFVKRWNKRITLRPIYGFKFGEFMGQPVIAQAHIAVRFRGIVLDWTARQFDPDAPVPKITTVVEFHQEWTPPRKRRRHP